MNPTKVKGKRFYLPSPVNAGTYEEKELKYSNGESRSYHYLLSRDSEPQKARVYHLAQKLSVAMETYHLVQKLSVAMATYFPAQKLSVAMATYRFEQKLLAVMVTYLLEQKLSVAMKTFHTTLQKS